MISRLLSRMLSCLALACALWSGSVRAEEYTLEPLAEGPTGLSPAITEAVAAKGLRLSGKGGVICDLWLSKAIPLKANFTPNIRVQYPFQNGQLIGAIRFPEATEPHDFRGQSIKPGLYTLRYGLQPDDGNHLGTSEIRDFLCACPPDADKDPKRIEKIKVGLPEPSVQEEIASSLDALDRKVACSQAKRSVFQDLFRTLLHELMTAKTRVHELDFSTGEHPA